MNTYLFAATIPGTDDSLLLLHAIQLTVLIVGLLAAGKLVLNSNKMTAQIANATKGLAQQFKIDKGLDAGRAKLGANAKKRAAYTGANLSQKMQDSHRFGGYPSRAIGSAANFRRNRKAGGKVRELALEARKSGREEDVTRRAVDIISPATTALGRSAAEVGGTRVEAYAADKNRQQFGENMKREEATMTSLSSKELARELRNALQGGLWERAHAASGLLVAKGAPDQALAADVLRHEAGGAAPGTQSAEMASSIIRSSGSEFNAVAPDLTRWAGQDMKPTPAVPIPPTLEQVSKSEVPYTNASPEKLASWSDRSILQAHEAAQKAGKLPEFQVQVNQLLSNPLLASKLSVKNRGLYEKINTGTALPPPGPIDPKVLYDE